MIRQATKQDAEAVKLIVMLGWEQAYSDLIPQDVQEKFMDRFYTIEAIKERIETQEFIVATQDDYVVGFANYDIREEDTRLLSLYVLPTHQKDGIGTQLMDYVENDPRVQHRILVVELENGNFIGETFYKRKGFEELEYLADDVFGHPVKTIILKKTIK